MKRVWIYQFPYRGYLWRVEWGGGGERDFNFIFLSLGFCQVCITSEKNLRLKKEKRKGRWKEKKTYHLTLGNIFNLPIWATIVSFIKWEYQELCCLLVQSTSIYWVYCLSCCELAIINVVRNWKKWFRWCVWLRESTQWMPLFFFHFSV